MNEILFIVGIFTVILYSIYCINQSVIRKSEMKRKVLNMIQDPEVPESLKLTLMKVLND